MINRFQNWIWLKVEFRGQNTWRQNKPTSSFFKGHESHDLRHVGRTVPLTRLGGSGRNPHSAATLKQDFETSVEGKSYCAGVYNFPIWVQQRRRGVSSWFANGHMQKKKKKQLLGGTDTGRRYQKMSLRSLPFAVNDDSLCRSR